jgi:hypothetical protein
LPDESATIGVGYFPIHVQEEIAEYTGHNHDVSKFQKGGDAGAFAFANPAVRIFLDFRVLRFRFLLD